MPMETRASSTSFTKKNKQEGFSGKVGFAQGFGALWVRKENLPTISPQYQLTPK